LERIKVEEDREKIKLEEKGKGSTGKRLGEVRNDNGKGYELGEDWKESN
jgi:hypothetical protein